MPVRNKCGEFAYFVTFTKTAYSLRAQNAVAQNLILSHGIAVYPAKISGIALYGIDDPVLHLLDDTHMVRLSILGAGAALVVPIEEDDHAGDRLVGAVYPLSSIFEPLDAVHTACIFGYNSGVNIAALIGAPAYKTSAPLHAAAKAVP